MNRLMFSCVMSLMTVAAFGLALMPLVDLCGRLAAWVAGGGEKFFYVINLLYFLPLVLLGLIGGADALLSRKKGRLFFWLYPLVIPQEDERERAIAAEASHAAFCVLWFAAPVCAALLVPYPLLVTAMPAYPIFVLLLLPAVQIIVYYVKIRKLFA